MNLPRMRTLAEAYKVIKTEDPSTSLTMTALRRLVVSGTLPCVKSGSKYLVNLDTLYSYLAQPNNFVNLYGSEKVCHKEGVKADD